MCNVGEEEVNIFVAIKRGKFRNSFILDYTKMYLLCCLDHSMNCVNCSQSLKGKSARCVQKKKRNPPSVQKQHSQLTPHLLNKSLISFQHLLVDCLRVRMVLRISKFAAHQDHLGNVYNSQYPGPTPYELSQNLQGQDSGINSFKNFPCDSNVQLSLLTRGIENISKKKVSLQVGVDEGSWYPQTSVLSISEL